jgi:o-succinylbenzoate---CoA ligase
MQNQMEKARGSTNIPVFKAPEPHHQFLASAGGIYEYTNLYFFAARVAEQTEGIAFSENAPLLISSASSDETVFLIASCFLLNIPFMMLNPEMHPAERDSILENVSPPLVYTDNPDGFPNPGSVKFFAPEKKWMTREAYWNDKLFTFGAADGIAGLFLTSGSSGTPKIVPIKRRQLFFAANASAKNFKPEPDRYWLLCLPLNHIGGVSIILRSLLYNSAIFRMDTFDLEQVRIFLSENPLFEAASLVPTMLIRVLEDPIFQIHPGIKAILLGGGPISAELIDKAARRGLPIVASYGMTETCAQICANPIGRAGGTYYPKTSAGAVFEPNEIQIRDENGKILPPIEEGLIWLRGPQVFDGYLESDKDEQPFDDSGWFNTGDYGHINRYGHLFVSSRRTDRIVTGGENVSPVQVEQAISELDGVKECAVIGIPDKNWGEKVVALVVPEKNMPESHYFIEKLKTKLNGYQIPKEFLPASALPRTALGKLRRDALKQLYKSLK